MIRVRTVLVVAAATAATSVLVGCGGDSNSSAQPADITFSATPSAQPSTTAPTPEPTAAATPTPDNVQVIKVTINENSVSPKGTRIKVKRNVPVVFEITAVQAGELHAHSTPGQELKYPKGKSEGSLTFKQPGIIAVEDHRLDQLVVQLEVR